MTGNAENGEDGQIHVLQIAGNAIVGGMEKYVYNLAQHLPSHQIKVSCVAPYESPFTSSLRNQGCDVFVTPMDNDPPWRSIQFLHELVRYHKVDLLHAHLPRAHVLAGLVGKLTGTPVIATIHGMDLTAHELGISRTTGTHLTVVCNDAYAQALNLGMSQDRLSLISNGVDLKLYNPSRSGISFRKAVHVPFSDPLIGFVGRIAWEKGPDQFVSLAEQVQSMVPEAHFAIVGEGPLEDEITRKIKDAHLENHIHLAGLWTNTWEVYPALDILVQTSRVEGMPFSLLEAMACGRPVAAIGVGGVAEIVEAMSCGVLSAPGDWRGLGDAVARLVSDTDRLKSMGHAARKRVEENFDLQNTIQLIVNLYRRLLGYKTARAKTEDTNWTRLETVTRNEKGDSL